MRQSGAGEFPKQGKWAIALRCAALLALGSTSVGCLDNSCEQIAESPVRYTDGITNAERDFYQSSKPGAPFLRFPAARVYRMEHGLARKPDTYQVVVAFLADGGDHVVGAGNLTLLNVDERYVQVENDTCTDLFVHVTASLNATPDTAAGSSPGADVMDAGTRNGSEQQTSTTAEGDAR